MITLKTKFIKALLLSAATNDIRYYLNGINIVIGNDETRLYSTNGHVLSVYRHKQQYDGEPISFIAPYSLCRLVKGDMTSISWNKASGQAEISMKSGDITYTCASIAGKYPDTSRVIPSESSGIPGQFQMKYMDMLNRIQKLIDPINEGQVIIHHNGPDNPSLVEYSYNHDFITVLMPVRCGDPNIAALEWAMPSKAKS